MVQVMGLEIGEIAELASDVAIAGAIRLTGAMGDELFEYIVAIAAVIYEMHPDA